MFRLYIGSNNNTHELEVGKIEQVMSKHFDGFTVMIGTGHWKSTKEKTAIVEVDNDRDEVIKVVHELKYALKQEAIAVQEVPSLSFI